MTDQFEPGDRVFWTDPDGGRGSGEYNVVEVEIDGQVYIENDEGVATEAEPEELRKI